MRRHHKLTQPLLILSVLSILLAGCSTNDMLPGSGPTWDTDDSRALKVMKAAGLDEGLNDVEVAELDLSVNSDGAAADSLAAVEAGGLLSGAISPPTHISAGAGAGILLLDMLANQPPFAATRAGLILWMPETPGEPRLEAGQRLSTIIEEATIEALPDGYEAQPLEWTDTATFGAKSYYRVIEVQGPACEPESCVIHGPFTPTHTPAGRAITPVELVDTPEFLPTTEAESWAYKRQGQAVYIRRVTSKVREESSISPGSWLRIETEEARAFDEAEWLARFSKNLPAWAFYYIGPQSQQANQSNIPILLNAGQTIMFAK